MRKYFYSVIFCFASFATVIAAPTAGELQRSEELLNENQAFINKFEQSSRVYIETIAVRSNIHLDPKKARELVKPYERSWLTKKELAELIEDIRRFYLKQGYSDGQIDISRQIIDDRLEIVVDISGTPETP